jgi:hypothetical protein
MMPIWFLFLRLVLVVIALPTLAMSDSPIKRFSERAKAAQKLGLPRPVGFFRRVDHGNLFLGTILQMAAEIEIDRSNVLVVDTHRYSHEMELYGLFGAPAPLRAESDTAFEALMKKKAPAKVVAFQRMDNGRIGSAIMKQILKIVAEGAFYNTRGEKFDTRNVFFVFEGGTDLNVFDSFKASDLPRLLTAHDEPNFSSFAGIDFYWAPRHRLSVLLKNCQSVLEISARTDQAAE